VHREAGSGDGRAGSRVVSVASAPYGGFLCSNFAWAARKVPAELSVNLRKFSGTLPSALVRPAELMAAAA
jgi:hypothetical protein